MSARASPQASKCGLTSAEASNAFTSSSPPAMPSATPATAPAEAQQQAFAEHELRQPPPRPADREQEGELAGPAEDRHQHRVHHRDAADDQRERDEQPRGLADQQAVGVDARDLTRLADRDRPRERPSQLLADIGGVRAALELHGDRRRVAGASADALDHAQRQRRALILERDPGVVDAHDAERPHRQPQGAADVELERGRGRVTQHGLARAPGSPAGDEDEAAVDEAVRLDPEDEERRAARQLAGRDGDRRRVTRRRAAVVRAGRAIPAATTRSARRRRPGTCRAPRRRG